MNCNATLPLSEVVSPQAKLPDHRGKQARAKLLAQILYDSYTISIIEQDVASFSALGVHEYLNAALSSQPGHSLNEFPTRHEYIMGHVSPISP